MDTEENNNTPYRLRSLKERFEAFTAALTTFNELPRSGQELVKLAYLGGGLDVLKEFEALDCDEGKLLVAHLFRDYVVGAGENALGAHADRMTHGSN
jgi:hypothetical protein